MKYNGLEYRAEIARQNFFDSNPVGKEILDKVTDAYRRNPDSELARKALNACLPF